MAHSLPQKRQQWSKESMIAAVQSIKDGMGIREASRLYNIPYETVRRRVANDVPIDARPGPPTVLTSVEEQQLATYCINMADMGFGLSCDDVMRIAFKIAENSGRHHPFVKGSAGRAWFEGFRTRHPKLTIRSAQSLSYSRAACTNPEIVSDYFAKLAALCAKLNLFTKPMNIYNMDETGLSIVHKPGRVVTELGRRNVWAITSAEKGKTHTVLTCVSASGYSLPPFMVYPRKRVSDSLKVGAVPGTSFNCSDSGWVNADLFYKWLAFFVDSIPPARPVLLVLDGHASHVTVEAIEFARNNDVHMLCLPAHTTHILQPLDVGVFKSLKANYYKACKKYITEHPGRVVTTENIASLLAAAWTQALTPVNIMSGFKKCGIYPLNPGEVKDRQSAPSKAVVLKETISSPPSDQDCNQSNSVESQKSDSDAVSSVSSPPIDQDRERLFEERYREEYDVYDEQYIAWLRRHHPDSVPTTRVSEATQGSASGKSVCSTHCGSPCTTSSLGDILQLPQPKAAKKKRQAVNSKAQCITASPVLKELKDKEQEKAQKEEEKRARKAERERKKEERLRIQTQKKKAAAKTRLQKKGLEKIEKQIQKLSLDDVSDCESEAECPKCGLVYGDSDDDSVWVQCDECNLWWDLKCSGIEDSSSIPDVFYCESCT